MKRASRTLFPETSADHHELPVTFVIPDRVVRILQMIDTLCAYAEQLG